MNGLDEMNVMVCLDEISIVMSRIYGLEERRITGFLQLGLV